MLSFEGRRWCVKEGAPQLYNQQAPEVRGLVCDILHERGVNPDETDRFLSPSLNHLHDPFLFSQMRVACERVFSAIDAGEPIMIHGDYDADGIGGSIILYETISALGGECHVFLPHRDEDGYGMNIGSVQKFIDDGMKLVITCDCGISNIDETRLLQDSEVDVIISDHHQFKDELPPAHAILHPGLPDEPYPDETLSGGGVAYKFADGLLRFGVERGHTKLPESIDHFMCSRLDLAAMSTIADMVPLLGESRVIALYGLQRLRQTKRPGFQALLSKLRNVSYDAETFSFGIGPKINAPGRMGSPQIAFDLLSTTDESRAYDLLAKIEDINKARRKATKEALVEAQQQIEAESQNQHSILFAYADHWPSGIVGLIAGRLKDMYHKPALVMSARGEGVVGSGRSTSQVNIVKALDEVKDCLAKYGGHKQACGFSLKDPSLVPYFEERLREVVAGMITDDSAPELVIDTELMLSEISWELIRDLSALEPYGMKNEQPKFMISNVQVAHAKAIGSTDKTLLLHVADDEGRIQKIIAFGKSEYVTRFHLGDRVDVVIELGINSYNGNQEIQCKLLDMRLSL